MAQDFADRSCTPGKILYLDYQFPTEARSHNKYFVVASADDPPLLLKIRSKLTSYAMSHPHIANFHLALTKTDYGFLDGDSFLNCSEVHYGLSLAEIKGQIVSDPSRVIGDLNSGEIAQVIELVHDSETISPKNWKQIIKALRA